MALDSTTHRTQTATDTVRAPGGRAGLLPRDVRRRLASGALGVLGTLMIAPSIGAARAPFDSHVTLVDCLVGWVAEQHQGNKRCQG